MEDTTDVEMQEPVAAVGLSERRMMEVEVAENEAKRVMAEREKEAKKRIVSSAGAGTGHLGRREAASERPHQLLRKTYDGEDALSTTTVSMSTRVMDLSETDRIKYYEVAWRVLGSETVHPRMLCGGTAADILGLLKYIHGQFVLKMEDIDMRVLTPQQAYERACAIYDVSPTDILTPRHIDDLYMDGMTRITKLFVTLSTEVTELALNDRGNPNVAHLAGMAVSQRYRDDGDGDGKGREYEHEHGGEDEDDNENEERKVDPEEMRDRAIVSMSTIAMEARKYAYDILQVLHVARDMILTMTNGAATLSPGCRNSRGGTVSQITALAFTNMAELKATVRIKLHVYHTLHTMQAKRSSENVMLPHKLQDGTPTCTYTHYKTIREFVEEIINPTYDFTMWSDGGECNRSAIIAELSASQTWLFAPIKIKQGVYSCRDGVMDLINWRFYFFRAVTDERVAALRVAVDAARTSWRRYVEQLERAVLRVRRYVDEGTNKAVELCEYLSRLHKSAKSTLEDLESLLPASQTPPEGLIAEQFIDQSFPFDDFIRALKPRVTGLIIDNSDGTLLVAPQFLNWEELRTPTWHHIFAHQKLTPDVIRIAAYVQVGRAIFPPGVRDSHQYVYNCYGFGNTGKSLQADVYERLHENMEARITHTGKISSNVEAKFGLSTIYGHTEDKRAFNAVCREYTEKLAENFQQSEWLMFAANEPFSMAVKHGDPIIGVPPHSQWFGNLQIPFVGRGSNVDRRLLTVHFCVPVKNADMTFKSKLFNEELLTLIVKGAWAYREFTGAYSDVGIWSAGVLPRYFQLQRDLNQASSNPLVAFLKEKAAHDDEPGVDGGSVTMPEEPEVVLGASRCMRAADFRRCVDAYTVQNKLHAVSWRDKATVENTLSQFGIVSTTVAGATGTNAALISAFKQSEGISSTDGKQVVGKDTTLYYIGVGRASAQKLSLAAAAATSVTSTTVGRRTAARA